MNMNVHDTLFQKLGNMKTCIKYIYLFFSSSKIGTFWREKEICVYFIYIFISQRFWKRGDIYTYIYICVCVCVYFIIYIYIYIYIYLFTEGRNKKIIIFILPGFSQLKREQSSEKTLIKDTSLTAKKIIWKKAPTRKRFGSKFFFTCTLFVFNSVAIYRIAPKEISCGRYLKQCYCTRSFKGLNSLRVNFLTNSVAKWAVFPFFLVFY